MQKNGEAEPDTEPPTEEAICLWLITNVAKELNLDPAGIDIRQTFAHYGLGSLQAVSLSGDLEMWLHRDVSPTVAWDYPTIEQLARHLTQTDANVNRP